MEQKENVHAHASVWASEHEESPSVYIVYTLYNGPTGSRLKGMTRKDLIRYSKH